MFMRSVLGAFLACAIVGVPAHAAAATATAPSAEANRAYLQSNAKKRDVVVVPGIQYRVLKSGAGAQPGRHDCVSVNYKGWMIDGKVFDETKGTPATFGVSDVIGGWTEVLQLMHVGDKWEVTIPPGLAYGRAGAGADIPPDQTLVFEIELLNAFPSPLGGCG